jgi:hypothetical protein
LRQWAVAALAVVCLVLAACSTSKSGSPASGTGGTTRTAGGPQVMPPATWSRSPTAPRDRDGTGVAAALAKLANLCDLVDIGLAHRSGFPPTPHGSAHNQTECLYLGINPGKVAGAEIHVRLNDQFTEGARYGSVPFIVGGFKAYWDDGTLSRQSETACIVSFPVSFTKSIDVWVKKDADTTGFEPCTLAKALAAPAVARATAVAGPSLLYRENEPDQPAEGACKDWNQLGTSDGCRLFKPATVPDDPWAMLEAGHHNTDVVCAATYGLVRKIVEPTLTPIVFGQSCVFVEPTHATMVSLGFSDVYRAADYKSNPDPSRVSITTVAGHPAISWDHSKPDAFGDVELQLFVSAGQGPEKPGVVQGHIILSPPRGSPSDAVADPARLPLLTNLLTNVMQHYLPL